MYKDYKINKRLADYLRSPLKIKGRLLIYIMRPLAS